MFLLIWKGWGIVVIGIAVVWIAIGIGVAGALDVGRSVAGAITAITLVPAGITCWFVGKRLNRTPPRVLLDPKTGAQVTIRRESSLFFVQVDWWGPILAAIGLVLCLIELVAPQ